jgi:ribose transport system substrate-binding protein
MARRLSSCSLVALAACTLAISACGEDEGSTAAGGAAAGDKKVRIGWFTSGPNVFYQASIDAAKEAAAKDGNAEVTVVDPNFDATKQINQLQDAITAQKFDAIILTPLNSVGVAPAVKQASDAGIAVIADNVPIGPALDTAEPQVPGQTGAVLQPSEKVAQDFAEMTIEACADKDPCKLAVLGGTGSTAFDVATKDAIKAAAEEHPNVKLVSYGGANYSRDPSIKFTQDFLAKDPDLAVIVAFGDQSALGALKVVQDAGKAKEIDVISGSSSARVVDLVRKGTLYGTVNTLPASEGRISAELAMKAARGEKLEKPGVDPVADSGLPPYMTQKNLDAFADFKGEWEG